MDNRYTDDQRVGKALPESEEKPKEAAPAAGENIRVSSPKQPPASPEAERTAGQMPDGNAPRVGAGQAPRVNGTPVNRGSASAVRGQPPQTSQPGHATPPRGASHGDSIGVERRQLGSRAPSVKESIAGTPAAQVPSAGNEEKKAGATRVMPTAKDATKKIDAATKTGSVGAADSKKRKKHTMTESSNTVLSIVKCMAYITAVLVISVVLSIVVIFAANDMYGFVKSTDPVEITIPENADINDVADILHDNNIIKYKWLFKLKEGNFKGAFAAGTYNVSPRTSYGDLVYELMEKPPTGISWVTIPEGFTTDEIIDLMVEKGIGEREVYVDVINNYAFDYWFVSELGDDWDENGRIYRLDGYLFPDTYQFYNASSEVTVINKLLKRFSQVFTESYKLRAEELGYTTDEILNLASLIEKEAGTAADFGKVSSVFHNRLNNSASYPKLESDATLAYAIQHETGTRPTITGADLDNNNSPYNSYKTDGLVPGPIANPSNSAILAALNPSETTYYYFVSSDTETIFSSTKAEHDLAVDKIRRENEEKASANE